MAENIDTLRPWIATPRQREATIDTGNNLDGSPAMEYHFTCKKFINKIAGSEVNVLIMKRLGVYRYRSNERIFVDNSDSLIYTLNKNDCKMYHIKYEPGIEVWPMSMKWIACNRDNENDDDRTIKN